MVRSFMEVLQKLSWKKIQIFQNMLMCRFTKVTRYVRNVAILNLKIKPIFDENKIGTKFYRSPRQCGIQR